MDIIPTVTQSEFELARKIEEKLLALPIESGVLFVGVSVHVSEIPWTTTTNEDGQVTERSAQRLVKYHIAIGLDRSFELAIVEPLIRVTLAPVATGINLVVEAYRGRIRKTA